MRILRSRKWRTACLTLLILVIVTGGTAWRHWPWIAKQTGGEYDRLRYAIGDHPVQRDLASGRFGAGSSVEDLLEAHPSDYVFRGNRYVRVEYKQNSRYHAKATVVARDGKITTVVLRRHNYDELLLFDEITKPELTAFQIDMTLARNRRQEARMAAVGFVGYIEPWQLPP